MIINIETKALRAISLFAAGKKDIRRQLRSVYFEASATKTRIIATNGCYMGVYQHAADNQLTQPVRVIVPLEALKGIKSFKGDTVIVTEASVQCGDNSTWYKPVEDTYPNYEQVIPKTVSGEAGQFDPDYMAVFSAALRELAGKKPGYPNFGYNCPTGCALVTFSGYEFIGAIMPVRGKELNPPHFISESIVNPITLSIAA